MRTPITRSDFLEQRPSRLHLAAQCFAAQALRIPARCESYSPIRFSRALGSSAVLSMLLDPHQPVEMIDMESKINRY